MGWKPSWHLHRTWGAWFELEGQVVQKPSSPHTSQKLQTGFLESFHLAYLDGRAKDVGMCYRKKKKKSLKAPEMLNPHVMG